LKARKKSEVLKMEREGEDERVERGAGRSGKVVNGHAFVDTEYLMAKRWGR